MTLYHFGNCLALAYAPYWIVYKQSGLSDYGAFWKVIQAGGAYALTQLIKMLLLATFFPTMDGSVDTSINFVSDILKCTVDLIDLAGLHLIMSRIAGKSHIKILTAGIGWAGAELVLSRVIVLWVGARGTEFDWKYVVESLDSNIALIHFMSTAALVWLFSRNDLPTQFLPAVVILLAASCYKSVICDVFSWLGTLSTWGLLAMRAGVTLGVSLVCLPNE
uniref:BOS complex subunit TMEM147 n=1 Tax=Lynceus sp. MCZ IZ 141354 TaxID=1930659 RepID=A0A9N6ZFR2_9CRUS|nr:EOG090X0CTK [Lynceus sp. MCZ IZ 141354]